jgi:hypothetical protein
MKEEGQREVRSQTDDKSATQWQTSQMMGMQHHCLNIASVLARERGQADGQYNRPLDIRKRN